MMTSSSWTLIEKKKTNFDEHSRGEASSVVAKNVLLFLETSSTPPSSLGSTQQRQRRL
jgi:hypothetical protein